MTKILFGGNAIAEYLGITRRQAYGLIERGILKTVHIGAYRATTEAWIDEMISSAEERAEQKKAGRK